MESYIIVIHHVVVHMYRAMKEMNTTTRYIYRPMTCSRPMPTHECIEMLLRLWY